MRHLVRYIECERYDPLLDIEVVRLMATTEKGSYHAEVKIEGPGSLRAKRVAFKEKVVELLRAGKNPCEVHIG